MQKLSESTNNQLIWIASISLLVGGIGVMQHYVLCRLRSVPKRLA